MSFTGAVEIWVVLGVLTLALALYRKVLTANETNTVHLSGDERAVPRQVTLANRLASIDRWGKALTVLVMSVGVCLGIAYLYFAFHDPDSAPGLRNLYKQNDPNP